MYHLGYCRTEKGKPSHIWFNFFFFFLIIFLQKSVFCTELPTSVIRSVCVGGGGGGGRGGFISTKMIKSKFSWKISQWYK